MRYALGLLGGLIAQTFYVEVGSETLRQALYQRDIQRIARLGGIWRSIIAVEPLLPRNNRALQGWFIVKLAGGDSVVILDSLRRTSGIRWAEGATGRRLCTQPLLGWHHIALQTPMAWTRTQGSSNIIIAIIDSGIEWTLPAFHRQLWVNRAEDLNGNGMIDPADLNGQDDDGNGFVDDIIGYDFTDQPFTPSVGDNMTEDPLPHDENGHGTAIASVIGARGDLSPVWGVAPGARLMILRAFNAEGYGEDDDIARAIIYAAENGARIINCSFGDRTPSRMMHSAIQYAIGRGCIIIAASGNGTGGQPHFPSGYPEVIATGGFAYDEPSGRYYLWPLSGYYRVDWVAPADRVPALLPDGSVRPLSGTSIAAALSSAAAALLLSRYPDLTGEGIRATFTSRAVPLSGSSWSPFAGSGRLSLLPAIDLPQEATAGWLYPPDRSILRSHVPIIFSAQHSLLSEWEISHALSMEGPWTRLARGTTPSLRDTLRGWTPTVGENLLRLRLQLRNGREVAYLLSLTYAPQGITLRRASVAHAWLSGVAGAIAEWHTDLPVSGCLSTDRGYFCADKVDSLGAVWLPPVNRADGMLMSFSDTISFPFIVPSMPPRALPYAPWNALPRTAIAGFYLPERGADWNADGEDDFIVSGFRPEDGRMGRLYFLGRSGDAFLPYDSAALFPLLPRDLRDWDGDGTPELLCVWIDSFYVLGGIPPKNLLWRGAGRAARLATSQAVWLRAPTGSYELLSRTGQKLLTLPDTVAWTGNTTIPRVVEVPTPSETLWAFGNYPGWIFLYRFDGTLLRTFYTALNDVGSHLHVIDTDADGWAEILYAGQGASGTWWEIGLISVRGDSLLWRERFWGGFSGRARLFLAGQTVAFWLPPHLYLGMVSATGWQGWAFDATTWEPFGIWEEGGGLRLLLGRDSVPRFHAYVSPPSAEVIWAHPGGLSPTQARLCWHALPYPTTYKLYRLTTDMPPILLYVGSDTSVIDSNLTSGQWYAYIVESDGAFSAPFFLQPGERPCMERALLDSTGLCVLRGRGRWTGEGTAYFRTLPDSSYPFFAWANGHTWTLSFAPYTGADSLWVDTLLTDATGMYLRRDCAILPIERTFPPSCYTPMRWTVSDPHTIEIDFSQALPPEAFEAHHYEIFPTGLIEKIDPTPRGLRLRVSLNLDLQPTVIRWRWGDPRCSRTVAFSPRRDAEDNWGFFPNPVRASDKALYFWGIPPGEILRVLTPSGALCALIHITEAEVPTPWDLRTFTGVRLSPGVYLIERKGRFEKVFVE